MAIINNCNNNRWNRSIGCDDVTSAENILNNVNNIQSEINQDILLVKQRYEKLVKNSI